MLLEVLPNLGRKLLPSEEWLHISRWRKLIRLLWT